MSSAVRPEPIDDPGGLIAGYRARGTADDPGGLIAAYRASQPPRPAPRDATQTLVTQPRPRIRVPVPTASIGPRDESPSTVTAKRLMQRTTAQAALGATPLGVATNVARLASPVVGAIEGGRDAVDDFSNGHPVRGAVTAALATLPFVGPAAHALGKAGTVERTAAGLVARAEGGAVGGAVRDGALHIGGASVDEAKRGQGIGTDLYRSLIDRAHADGLSVFSDATVEAPAARVYDRLRAAGYDVRRNPNAVALDDGTLYVKGSGAKAPVFEVRPSPGRIAGDSVATKGVRLLRASRGQEDAARAPSADGLDPIREFVARHEDYLHGAELRQLHALLPEGDARISEFMERLGTADISAPITPQSTASIRHLFDFDQVRAFSARHGQNNPTDLAHADFDGLTSAARGVGVEVPPPQKPSLRIVGDSTVSKGARLLLPQRREAVGTPYHAPVDDGKDPRLANIAKLGLSPEAEQKVRAALATMDPAKKTVTHEETKAVASELGINPNRLLSRTDRMSGAELLAVRDVVSQNAERLVTLSKDAAALTPGTPERLAVDDQITKLSGENDEFLVRYTKERSQAGRDLNALKIVARRSMDLPVWQVQAQRIKGPLPLSPDEHRHIIDLVAGNDRDGLVRYVAGLHKSSPLDKGLAIWKAGLLSNLPISHGVNAASNATMAALETAKEPLAGVIDAAISLARGTPRTKAVSLRGLTSAQTSAAWKSRHEVLATLKHGDADALAKWDFRKVNFGDGPAGRVAQAYTDAIFNSYAAADKPFKAAAVGRSVEEQIRVRARRAADPAAEMARLRAQPDADMVVQAAEDAEYATFQGDNIGTAVVGAVKRKAIAYKGAVGGEVAKVAIEGTVPFVRTPTNVAARLVDYSPAGLITTALRQVRNPNQKRLAEDLARNITGGGLVTLGVMLAVEGKATGTAPTDPSERAQWALEGKQPNSVRIGNTWVNVSRIAPAGALIAVGAQMTAAAKAAKSPGGALGAAIYAPPRVALDQSFLKSVSGTLAAANDPGRYFDRLEEQTVGSVVPAGVAAIARAADPLQREHHGPAEAVVARIPGASRTLPAKLDAFGKPVANTSAGGKAFYDILQTRPANTDPLVQELARVGVTVGMPGKLRTVARVKETRTPAEYRAFLAESGPAIQATLRDVVAAPEYQAASSDEQRAALENVIRSVRTQIAARERERIKLARQGTPPTTLGTP